jgi:diguanylate cyclase (GGDEF)-like protein
MINTKEIVIIDDKGDVFELTSSIFKKEKDEYDLIRASSEKDSINNALAEVPNLIIINADGIQKDALKICETIRKNLDNSITPIIVTGSVKDVDYRVEFLKRIVEYYIPKPLNKIYFYYTIKNLSRLIDANRCISNLTGLPGNMQIEIELKKRVSGKKLFAVLYVDLDSFKAYNDKYGFMNGDEVIKFTANCMKESIQKYGEKKDFLGHIGGDDFVAIVEFENARKIGKDIIKRFDKGIIDYYSDDDVENRYVKVLNRRGKLEKYPLMTISVAMISNKYRKYSTVLELGEDGASVKKMAKTIPGSTFLENRRRGR